MDTKYEKMKESWSETLWNEEIRRHCREGEVSKAERWYGYVIRRD